MRRRALFTAAVLPAVPASVAAEPRAFAPPFPAYTQEAFWDHQDSGAPLAVIVAREGCTNTAALDRARRSLRQGWEAGMGVLESSWEAAQDVLVAQDVPALGLDEVRVLFYQDGALSESVRA